MSVQKVLGMEKGVWRMIWIIAPYWVMVIITAMAMEKWREAMALYEFPWNSLVRMSCIVITGMGWLFVGSLYRRKERRKSK